MEIARVPYIPETAPFSAEQRAWLNGFLAGMFSQVPAAAGNAQPDSPRVPREPLLILFGSQTGTAESLAKRLAKESEQRGFQPVLLPLDEYEKAGLPDAKKLIIVSSTWGDGDPPENAVKFWSWLNSNEAPRFPHLDFAVLGLGDRNYSDFCGASKKFDVRLEELGGHRIIPRAECDVDYESTANRWIENLWVRLAGARSSPGAATTITNDAHLPLPARNGQNGFHVISPTQNGSTKDTLSLFGKKNPFPARLLKNIVLNKSASAKEVRHYELSLSGSDLTYEVGDALGIYATNCPQLVDDIIEACHCSGDEPVEIEGSKMLLRESLTSYFDICRPSTDLLSIIAKAAPDCGLVPLLKPERTADLKKSLWGRDILDVLRLLPSPLPPEQFVLLLRKLTPRLYSISSSPKAHTGEVHLIISTVRYESFGRARKGVASCFLADRCGENSAKVFVQKSHGFKPPREDLPMIMVGPGTGIAPFRAFLEEREATGAKGQNWLFFGDQKRSTDFLYEEQLTGWLNRGHLTHLDVAFSRDQEEKIYVQHRLVQNAPKVWSWLEEGAHFYVCGDASRMAADVDRALHQVIERAGGKTTDQAAEYVAKLKSEKRYQRDIY